MIESPYYASKVGRHSNPLVYLLHYGLGFATYILSFQQKEIKKDAGCYPTSRKGRAEDAKGKGRPRPDREVEGSVVVGRVASPGMREEAGKPIQ